ncbi:efflux RND transporter periplasmic adaptor subunit [Sphingobacterium wenxiniae]|uniref:Membrane fusion protein, multidrug efflux system n=1 Tax=Sphingobacterium wenxiniae TaxID=683125 RepID=A0A1I6T834_9SPHI|nr:efflux RND transporter periplasmic adaptor subunit [Sphingobacterium wenxiniae]SFS85389.1 membrane fusion protein, multidrug efflux system [Sphingobacterium wenxiniae]
MKKKSIIALSLLLLGVIALVFYRIDQNKKKEEKNSGGFASGNRSGAKVFGKVIFGQPFSDYISLSGSIEANEQVDIHPEIGGIIESINFNEGSQVSQGQVLVRINDAELRAQLAQAKTRNELSAENERRAKLLLEKEAISQEEYDIASADYRTAQSQIQLIQAQLDKTVVKAPFSGVIGLRNISKGSYISSTISIARLVNTAQVKLLFAIPEKYAYMVAKNKPVHFTVQGYDVAYTAKIYATEPSIEANTRTLLVRAIAENPSNNLIPGAFANVTFPLEDVEKGLLVPAEALIPIQNGKKLFVVKNGKAKEVLVETGGRTAADVLVTKGIYEGDTVLTSGVMSLRDGSAVEVNLR